MAAKKKAAPKAATKKKTSGKRAAKRAAPKFKFPAKGNRCEKEILPKTAFHEKSFRNMMVKDKEGKKVFLTIGCLKKTKPRGADRGYKTVWRTEAPFVETRSQCRYSEGPLKGEKAGTRGHMTTRESVRGRCKEGYKKYVPPKPKARR